MKKHLTKIICISLVLITLVTALAIPVAAAYPMSCTIYYKDESGNQVATTKSWSMDAADTTADKTLFALCIGIFAQK